MPRTRPKRVIRPVPLAVGYALGKMRPLHRFMPDRVLYKLPLSWNFEMLRSFLAHRLGRVYIDVHCKLDPPASFAPRVEAAPPYALSEGDVRQFYDDGFLGPFELCPPEAMAARQEKMWGLWDAPSKTYPPGSYRFVGDDIDAGRDDEMTNAEYATRGLNARDKHLDDPELLDLYAHPAIVERVAQLLGPDLLLWRSQFFPKYPKMGGTGWHQASSYLNETMRVATLTPPDLSQLFQLTVWVAITDSTRENGCLRVVRGSHREIEPMRIEEYDPVKHADNKMDRFGTRLLQTYNEVDPSRVVDLEMKAGQFVIFTERLMHGALPNSTEDQSRLGMSARYVVPSVKIHNPLVLGEEGLSISYLRIAGLQLDRWRAILVRGSDRSGVNGDRVVPYVGAHAQPGPHPRA
ncbi:MAG: phytanoyl-CoA dioxygenase family protein [Myxococcales bacterium]|nr:phytanoyl-CoA dioxygenase family protein [Myxococcales bacterium]